MASAIYSSTQTSQLSQSAEQFPQNAFLRILEITATSYGLLPVVPTRHSRFQTCPRQEYASVRVLSNVQIH